MLYQSYGFPLEMTKELAQEQGGIVDEAGFQEEMSRHQQLSRTAAAGKFKGGLADNSLATTRLHTAAHLLLQALRQVLGEGVYQRGSNITPERLRFDFSYPNKLTPEEIKQVEDIVNKQIALDLPVTCKEMSLQEARRAGAMGVFDAKYGERVKVYTIGSDRPFSQEICGGPHVQRTGELGHFRIIKEESSSAGVRRIKAILED
jgi:alanyl-tRNA synthetase